MFVIYLHRWQFPRSEELSKQMRLEAVYFTFPFGLVMALAFHSL